MEEKDIRDNIPDDVDLEEYIPSQSESEEGGLDKIDLKSLKKVDWFGVGVIFSLIASFISDIFFFIPLIGLLVHLVLSIPVFFFIYPHTKGFLTKLALFLSLLSFFPLSFLPTMTLFLFLAILMTNSVIIRTTINVAALAAIAATGVGAVAEGAAGAGAAAEQAGVQVAKEVGKQVVKEAAKKTTEKITQKATQYTIRKVEEKIKEDIKEDTNGTVDLRGGRDKRGSKKAEEDKFDDGLAA